MKNFPRSVQTCFRKPKPAPIDVYKRLGGKKVLVTAPASDEDDNHVLCNPILSPSSVGWLEAVILSFAKQHVKTVLDWA